MRSSVALTLMVATLLLVSQVLPRFAIAQPSLGDWVVTGKQVVQNESITLNGNLTVESGGNLTLQDSSLAMGVRANGQYGIFVEPGGALYVRSTTIGSIDGVHRFVFQVDGSAFVMENSTLSGAGWCDITPAVQGTCFKKTSTSAFNGLQGLQVETNGAVIVNDTISGSGVGITLTGFGDLVRGDTIESSNITSLYIAVGDSSSTAFSNDTVRQNEFYQEGLTDNSMIMIGGSGNMVENNTLAYHLVLNQRSPVGITDSGWDNKIQFNSITAKGGIGLNPGVSDAVISHNSITFCEQGIWAAGGGSGDLIASNTLYAGLSSMCNDVYGVIGMQIQAIRDSVIEENTLVGPVGVQHYNGTWNPMSSLYLIGAYHDSVLDNTFTFSGSEPPLYVVDSADIFLQGNMFSSPYSTGWAGVFLDASNNNKFTDNSFNSSAQYSIALEGSNSNSIYGNSFSGTGEGAYDAGTNNSWSSGSAGNYWSESSGSGGYRIPPNGTDYHPLSVPVKIAQVPLIQPTPVPLPLPYTGPQCNFSISNTTVISNGFSSCPAGTVEVKPGGHLRYSNETLAFGMSGGFNFQVDQGGTLLIQGSNVTWGQGNEVVNAGSNLTIEDTKITVMGASNAPLTFGGNGAVTVTSSIIRSISGSAGFLFRYAGNCSIDVSNSLLQGGAAYLDDLSILTCGPVVPTDHPYLAVENSVIEDGVSGISTGGGGQGETLIAINDTFKDLEQPMTIDAGSAIVSHDLIYSSIDGLQVTASNVTVSYDTLLKSWTFGISVNCGGASSSFNCGHVGDTIGNYVNANYSGLVVDANGTIIADNTATGPKGSLVVNGNDDDVYGNNVSEIQVNGLGNNLHGNFISSSSTKVSTTSTTSSSSEIVTNSTSSASTIPGGKGIPEFPFLPIGAAAVVLIVTISYLLTRRKRTLSPKM